MGEFPSGQREQTVNLSSVTSVVRIHPLPPIRSKLKLAPFCFAGIKEKAGAKTITALASDLMFEIGLCPNVAYSIAIDELEGSFFASAFGTSSVRTPDSYFAFTSSGFTSPI